MDVVSPWCQLAEFVTEYFRWKDPHPLPLSPTPTH